MVRLATFASALFVAVACLAASPAAPIIRSETAFLLEKDLIPESIAYDPKTRAFYVGSMYKAKIVKIASDRIVTDFVPPRRDGLLSVLGMKIHPLRRELWAVAGNFMGNPPMERDDPQSRGTGAIFRFDLDSGRLIRKYRGPGGTPEKPMWFNDLVIASNGDVYVTAGPLGIWRLPNGADGIEEYFAHPGSFFNGIAITSDGQTLFAASHVEGVMRIDVASKTTALLEVPRGATLSGIDGLYVHGASLVGVQNGTDPSRVIRAWLNPDMTRVIRFDVLEQAHPLSDIPLTGTIVGNDLYYVARSQLRAFENGKIWPMNRLEETVILRLPLDVPVPPPDPVKEKEALLETHQREIRAHLERDARWIGKTTASEFITSTAGKIERASRADVQKFFESYFEGATYLEYEDLEAPVFDISDDGSMAWMISRTKVRRRENGQERRFVYAGIMTYRKEGGQWIRVANVSTFEPALP